jgi:hypothetical protein
VNEEREHIRSWLLNTVTSSAYMPSVHLTLKHLGKISFSGLYRSLEQITRLFPSGHKNMENDITEERRKRLTIANKWYFSIQKHLKSIFISNDYDFIVQDMGRSHNTACGEVLNFIPNRWQNGGCVLRKVLRIIYGPTKDRDQWGCRFNWGLHVLFKEPRLSVVIRIVRLSCRKNGCA